jgi:uncharacterized protein YdeI (YjbR/CyaY-like superfamily)
MHPEGHAKVEWAKKDGSWNALDTVEALEMPADLAKALAAGKKAQANFAAFSVSSRKGILSWIVSAKRPETRAARVAKTVRMAATGLRAPFDRE